MQNNLRKFKIVYLFVSCFSIISCTSIFKDQNFKVIPLKVTDQRTIHLKSEEGRVENIKYFSHSKIKSFEEQQLIREKDEIVEFLVESKSLASDQGNIRNILTTLEKDGLVDLHDLAFPEVKERIEFVFKPNAEVLYAGSYPKSSVFYVPPLSLPSDAVKVGDTWEMQRSWISMKNNIPFTTQGQSPMEAFGSD